MSLVFAAITPHSPLLVPTVGKEQLAKAEKTKTALMALEQELYTTRPQVIIIISPHSGLFEDAFSVNAHTEFTANFEQFGDLTTKLAWKGAPNLAAKISHASRSKDLPVQLVSREELDYGASVPLSYLTNHLEDAQVLPIGFSNRPTADHLRLGELLRESIAQGDRRVAVISSGDLSHAADEPDNASRYVFDEKLRAALANMPAGDPIALDVSAKDSGECGYRSILILCGALRGMNVKFQSLRYEHPFGVGYLTGYFQF